MNSISNIRRYCLKTALFLFALGISFIPFTSAERFIPKSDLIIKVLEIVNQLYVDQNRVRPLTMLEGSLERLSANIAPVLTELESKNSKVYIDVSVDQFKKRFVFDSPMTVSELNSILQQIVGFIKQNLDKEEKPEFVDYAVINGFLRQLDPHSSLLIPEIYEDFSAQTSGNFGGVGMMISVRDGNLIIVAPIEDTPASRAGLKANDIIVQINEESTVNMALSDAVKKLRGKEGTEVDVYITRKGWSAPKKITLVRDNIEINSVKSFAFQENGKRVGLLKINTFQQNTIDEINSHLEDLDYDLKDFYGLIIDLRNNPGGLLDQAIKVSDRFLSDGVIVSTAGLQKDSIRSYSAHWFLSITDLPIIILINNGSASASEIVAAALKKNNRAVVLGIQTFGKGSVQQVIPLPGGSALRLTTSKYLTPGNVSIQSVGVSPHIAVNPYYVSSDFLHLTKPKLDQAENSLNQNFSEWGDQAEPPVKSVYYLYDNKKETEEADVDLEGDAASDESEQKQLENDFLVQSAVKILIQNGKKNNSSLLNESIDYLDKQQSVQEQKLVERFAGFANPIDWKLYDLQGKSELVAKTWIEIKSLKTSNEEWKPHNGFLPANSEIRLYLEAKNTGKNRISRLMAISECENQLFNDLQFAFGRLEKGESKKWYVPIKISESISSRNDLITFKFTDQSKTDLVKSTFIVQSQQKETPEFSYAIAMKDNGEDGSRGNGNGVIETDETIAIKVAITNKGKGDSGPITILLKNGEGKDVFLKVGRQSLESLKPDSSGAVAFLFEMKKKPADRDLDFSLDIIDSVFTVSSLNHKLKITTNEKVTEIFNKPPSILLDSKELTSASKQYELRGEINDLKGVKDIFVFNNKKKVFYKNFLELKDRTRVSFKLNLTLEEEINKMTILSRDEDDVTSQRDLFIRYTEFK